MKTSCPYLPYSCKGPSETTALCTECSELITRKTQARVYDRSEPESRAFIPHPLSSFRPHCKMNGHDPQPDGDGGHASGNSPQANGNGPPSTGSSARLGTSTTGAPAPGGTGVTSTPDSMLGRVNRFLSIVMPDVPLPGETQAARPQAPRPPASVVQTEAAALVAQWREIWGVPSTTPNQPGNSSNGTVNGNGHSAGNGHR